MDYAGGPDRLSKRARADLLALALTMALLEGDGWGWPVRRRAPAARKPNASPSRWSRARRWPGTRTPPRAQALRPGQRVILFDDFLGDPQPVLDYLHRAAGFGVRGALVQVLDPDEEGFPWTGAVLFRSASGALRHDTRDAGGLRAAYLARLAERRALLSRAALNASWHFGTHDTAAAPAQALLWLWSALEAWMLTLGPLGFLAPRLLTGLIALPAIWLILRVMPPSPKLVRFAGTRLLSGLKDAHPVARGTRRGGCFCCGWRRLRR